MSFILLLICSYLARNKKKALISDSLKQVEINSKTNETSYSTYEYSFVEARKQKEWIPSKNL